MTLLSWSFLYSLCVKSIIRPVQSVDEHKFQNTQTYRGTASVPIYQNHVLKASHVLAKSINDSMCELLLN